MGIIGGLVTMGILGGLLPVPRASSWRGEHGGTSREKPDRSLERKRIDLMHACSIRYSEILFYGLKKTYRSHEINIYVESTLIVTGTTP